MDVLVPDLGRSIPQLGNGAVASLCDKPRVRIGVARHHSSRQHPRLHENLGVFDGDVVQEYIALAPESLYNMHVAGVEETATPEPCRIGEPDGVENQRVAFPAS